MPSERYSPVRRTSEPVVTSSEHLEQPNIRNIQQEHFQLQVNLTGLCWIINPKLIFNLFFTNSKN